MTTYKVVRTTTETFTVKSTNEVLARERVLAGLDESDTMTETVEVTDALD